MRAANRGCRPEWIEQFLSDRMTAREQEAFESHLEGCPRCRRRLEMDAAEPSWWQESRDHLSPGEGMASSPRWEGGRDATSGLFDRGLDEAPPCDGGWDPPARALSLAGLAPFLSPGGEPGSPGRIGKYEIREVIGRGGMGVVLEAFDAGLGRVVAIKLLAPEHAVVGTARRRFAREAQAAAAVVHDNVMAIHEVAECGGLPYLVMPYARGGSLERRLRKQGPLPLDAILRIGKQVADGLAAAHAQGLIHRDIKPANILLEEGVDRVRITDFGLARAADDANLTRSGVIAGTPQYMSPEQAAGEAIDPRSDLFSLGGVLYAMATGRPPFRAETPYGVLRKICEEPPRPIRELNPEIPDWFERLVGRLHAKPIQDRYRSASEVAAILEGCLAHSQQPHRVALPAGIPPAPRPRRLAKASTRIAAPLLALAIAAALIVGINRARQRNSESASIAPLPQDAAIQRPIDDPALRWDDGLDWQLDQLELEIRRLSTD